LDFVEDINNKIRIIQQRAYRFRAENPYLHAAKIVEFSHSKTPRLNAIGLFEFGMLAEASKLDWERFRELFEAEYLPGLRERSREKYATVLDVFEQIISPTKLRAVTDRTISLFVKGMCERRQRKGKVGLEPITIRNYLVALQRALKWAVCPRDESCWLSPCWGNPRTTASPRIPGDRRH
jgi:hypothetical protein